MAAGDSADRAKSSNVIVVFIYKQTFVENEEGLRLSSCCFMLKLCSLDGFLSSLLKQPANTIWFTFEHIRIDHLLLDMITCTSQQITPLNLFMITGFS